MKQKILFGCLLATASLSVFATTYYVSPSGDGSEPTAGFATGFSTIEGAIADSRVIAGDTLLLDKATFLLAASPKVSKAITLRGAGENWETVLDGNKAMNMSVSVAGAFLHNFTITNMGDMFAGTAGIGMSAASTISNIVVRQVGNQWTGSEGTRFPLDVKAGLVTHCWITNNIAPNNAGVQLSGSAVMENCYIADNVDRGISTSESQRGIVVLSSGSAILRNCTIVNNSSAFGAVYVRSSPCQVYNNIICYNTVNGELSNWTVSNASWKFTNFKNNCSMPVAGWPEGNTEADPLLYPDNLHFFAASPCKGTADATKAPSIDIFGSPRGDSPSMGCVEYRALPGNFVCAIVPSAVMVTMPEKITLGVAIEGNPSGTLSYAWDFDGDGQTDSTDASPEFSSSGKYRVSVKVTDGSGTTASASYAAQLTVRPVGGFVIHVSPTGDGTNPYGGFATGLKTLAEAVALATTGETVLLDRATFYPTAKVTVSKAITIRGAGENWETVFDGNNKECCIIVSYPGALLHNFTITRFGGQWSDTVGFQMSAASTISNVVARQIGNGWTGAGDGTRIVWKIENGLVTHCWNTNNIAPGNAGFFITGGTVENCYIADNVDRGCGGSYLDRNGIVQVKGGTLRNCTIVDNQSAYGGVFYRSANGKIYNNLIWGNTFVNSAQANNWVLDSSSSTPSTAAWLANCTTPLCGAAENGNIASDPLLQDDRMHFARLSPCNGAANASKAPAYDLAGLLRTTPSIGAFEYVAGGFSCSVVASQTAVNQPEKVLLSCGLDGDYAEPLTYFWDLVGDGSQTATGATAELTEIGVYRPSVTVTDANGKKTSSAYSGAITVYGESGAVFVTSSGHATAKPPYASRATAATNLADVIDYAQAGNEVRLDAGLHVLTGTVTIAKALTIKGLPGETFVGHTNTTRQLFVLRNQAAALEGLTVRNGNFLNYAGGAIVLLAPGQLRDCRFLGNAVCGHGGVMTESAGSVIERCVFAGNYLPAMPSAQGPMCVKVKADNTVVRNCLFVGNTNYAANVTLYYSGAAINMANSNSSVLNCTFVDNFTSNALSAAICLDENDKKVGFESVVRNCVSTGNRRVVNRQAVDGNDLGLSPTKLSDSLVWPTAFDYSSFTNVKTVDPLLNPATLKPRGGSPCVNAGALLDYTADSVDLEGNPRVYRFGTRYGIPDLGCYETAYGVPGMRIIVK